jgi:hypothetical protein
MAEEPDWKVTHPTTGSFGFWQVTQTPGPQITVPEKKFVVDISYPEGQWKRFEFKNNAERFTFIKETTGVDMQPHMFP